MFDLNSFIDDYVTRRTESIFEQDLQAHRAELKREIRGSKVLVIGGAGSIGSAFIKCLLPYRPGALFVVDINENGLTELTRDLRSTSPEELTIPDIYRTYAFDFGGRIFSDFLENEGGFDIVANFAAHKHVRSEKDVYSIRAMLRNNVLSNHRLLQQLSGNPPKHFFCVSTDKAANPVSVMGATKRLMEELLFSYSQTFKTVSARFANVAFSNGSLPASFQERILKRQPLVAPTDVKRYFVSPRESGELCLLACILGRSGEVFFPKLATDTMLTFAEIARSFLREYGGYTYDEHDTPGAARQAAKNIDANSRSYPVYFFRTDTSGEKPYEEFFTEQETVDSERFLALGIITPEGRAISTSDDLTAKFEELFRIVRTPNVEKQEITAALARLIPNFDHIETGNSLDQKM